MDVMRLSKTTFLPVGGLVEGHTSMIWTERHSSLGDFERKSPRIQETLDDLPKGSLVAIRGSDEVCMVETHTIDTNDDGVLEITTTGRSLEAFLANRILTGPYLEPWQIPGQYTVQDAILMYIWNSIVNSTTFEVIRDYSWPHLAREIIPNVVVSDSTKPLKAVVGEGTIEDLQTIFDWWLDVGPLDVKVQDMLTLGNLGIRIIRPFSKNANIVTSVENGMEYIDPKSITKVISNTDKLRFDIYNGRNRTISSATNTPLDVNSPVTFSYSAGHIDKPQYLFSDKEKKNMVFMQSPFESVEIYNGEVGLDLFEEWVESGPMDDSLSGVDYTAALNNKALAELKRHKELKIIEGGISGASPWRYGTDFYLGDLITVSGNYRINEAKMVSEYIRSDDQSGEKAYPTLIDPP